MDDSKKRRIRGPNFSNDEKLLLLKLVDKYKDILECKRTDGTTWRDKKDTWTRVAREFNANSCSSERRTAENIKTCYENLKKCTKKMALIGKPSSEECFSCNRKYDPVFELTLSILNKTIFREGASTRKHDEDTRYIETTEMMGLEEVHSEKYSDVMESIEKIKTETDYYSSQTVEDEFNETEESCSQRSETEIVSENVNQDLVALKTEMYRQQLLMLKKEEEYKEKQRRREETEFEIEKRKRERKWELEEKSLLLDIKIKEAQLKNLNLNLNLI